MADQTQTISEFHDKIELLKRTAQDLNSIADNFPTIARNTARILASVRMLEINFSDLVELG